MWLNQFMINTNDGYFFAEGARDLLSAVSQNNDLSPVDSSLAQLTYFVALILPLSFETILLYMPAFFSSLVVIPILLIAKTLNNIRLGVITALLASIAWSYYNRTMVGYYDTDMLNIVFPMILIWTLIKYLDKPSHLILFIMALDMVAYRWWYPQSYSLEFAMFGLMFLYVIVYDRKNLFHWQMLTMMLLAMNGLPDLYRLILVILFYVLFQKELVRQYLYYIFGFTVGLFLMTGGFDPIWNQLQGYVFRSSTAVITDEIPLYFYTVLQTIREAGKIPFETFANRISGHQITFIISIIGYILLVLRHKVMLLGLPMIGLGFLAYVGGLRFTIYAVPFMAFGAAYFILYMSNFIAITIEEKYKAYVQNGFIVLATLAVLYPNLKHAYEYRVPTVFNANEVQVLDQLHKKTTREDYVVSWWDYGYPIRYYSDVKTLADGGKHSGEVNYPLSYALLMPQQAAATMARLDVEYNESSYLLRKQQEESEEEIKVPRFIHQMMSDNGVDDPKDFLSLVAMSETVIPEKTRDIYYYLPLRMMNIVPTIELFSNIDITNGKQAQRSLFVQTQVVRETSELLQLAQNIRVDKKKGVITIGKQQLKVGSLTVTQYQKNGKLGKSVQRLHGDGNIHLIYMRNYNKMLVLNQKMYDSTYIQLFVLENIDSRYFEPTILTPVAKVFKLKI
jgi:dolichyl-diphosphooligosaccharide--protein glycosyltransferase/undecaprenyl-diphosphooligosaccharide--protein glycosyltransferase